MLKRVKQHLDRWAINVAAKSLPPGKPDSLKCAKAGELLRDPGLLRPVEATAHFQRNESGPFQFTSSIATPSSKNDLVHGRLFTCHREWAWQSRPVVILVHGWNAELHYLYILPRLARALNKRGLNAALLELPYHLHRRPPPDAPGMRDFISDDLPGMLLATRQALSDIHALARWTRAQGSPRVAVWGFSLGAWLAGLYVCQSDAASAAVLTTPVTDLGRAVGELAFCHPVRACLNGAPLDLRTLNLTAHRPQIPAQAIRVTQSGYDLFVPEETYRQLAEAWTLPGWETVAQSHLSVLVSRRTMKESIEWLAQKLL